MIPSEYSYLEVVWDSSRLVPNIRMLTKECMRLTTPNVQCEWIPAAEIGVAVRSDQLPARYFSAQCAAGDTDIGGAIYLEVGYLGFAIWVIEVSGNGCLREGIALVRSSADQFVTDKCLSYI